jgi:hypothetical protein
MEYSAETVARFIGAQRRHYTSGIARLAISS